MPCYHPLTGYRSQEVNESGKRSITFNPSRGYRDMEVQVPCGQCVGCRLERSRQWALRCLHESSLHSDNCFITLTYSDSELPQNASLNLVDFQNFMKRFRKAIAPKRIRFFHCGEYGDNDYENNPKHLAQYGLSPLGRPHYHALIFGYDFMDKELIRERDGIKLFTSGELASFWPHGFNTVGEVNFESAAYCARYCVKKVTGDKAADHYRRVYTDTGQIVDIEPEYTTMSRRPGIGAAWFDRYKSDVYPKDFTTVRGRRIKPPKFYDRKLEESDPALYERVQADRRRSSLERELDNTLERLAQKEKVKLAQAKMLERNLND
jgi:hypothetical protein